MHLDYIFVVDNTASIVLKQEGFSTERSVEYMLEIEISDGGTPEQKSINSLHIKVCTCQSGRRAEYCRAYAQTGVSVSALLAILLCIVTILGKCVYGYISLFLVLTIHVYLLFQCFYTVKKQLCDLLNYFA